MSDNEVRPVEPSRAPPAPGHVPPRSGCLTAFMVVIGIILLLPGLCAVIFNGCFLQGPLRLHFPAVDCDLPLVALGGILLIRAAIRGARR